MGSRPDTARQLRIPQQESKELPGRFLETNRDWGPAKAFADWQSRPPLCLTVPCLPCTVPHACLLLTTAPRSGLVSFSFDSFSAVQPPALAAKLPPKARILAWGTHDRRVASGVHIPFQLIPPAWSMQCHTCAACQTVRHGTSEGAIQTTRSQCTEGRPTLPTSWRQSPVRISFLIPGPLLLQFPPVCVCELQTSSSLLQQVHSQPPASRLSPPGGESDEVDAQDAQDIVQLRPDWYVHVVTLARTTEGKELRSTYNTGTVTGNDTQPLSWPASPAC